MHIDDDNSEKSATKKKHNGNFCVVAPVVPVQMPSV
jgi:hypothetical protein